MRDCWLVRYHLIFLSLPHVSISRKIAIVEWIRTDQAPCVRIVRYQAFRDVGFGSSGSEGIHPLGPSLVQAIKII